MFIYRPTLKDDVNAFVSCVPMSEPFFSQNPVSLIMQVKAGSHRYPARLRSTRRHSVASRSVITGRYHTRLQRPIFLC